MAELTRVAEAVDPRPLPHTKTEYSNLDAITWNYYSTNWNNKPYSKY